MKKILSLILLLSIVFSFVSCDNEESKSKKTSASKKSSNSDEKNFVTPEFLTDADWGYYDSEISEKINISFYEDGTFFYCCDCGEPVGDSDIYDRYSYNEQKNEIILYACEGSDLYVPVVYCDEFCLVLEIYGEIVDFENYNMKVFEETEQTKPFLEDHLASITILEYDIENGIITAAPANYDADAKKSFEDKITQLYTVEEPQINYLTVTVENDVQTELIYAKVAEEDYQYIGEYYDVARIKFNADHKIESILFYGYTQIYTKEEDEDVKG
ncbi:MAG: hypothetical protein J6J13_03870 [Clostridia bacterium]|nr:hypothetical protein [Clostridia bacterium]